MKEMEMKRTRRLRRSGGSRERRIWEEKERKRLEIEERMRVLRERKRARAEMKEVGQLEGHGYDYL